MIVMLCLAAGGGTQGQQSIRAQPHADARAGQHAASAKSVQVLQRQQRQLQAQQSIECAAQRPITSKTAHPPTSSSATPVMLSSSGGYVSGMRRRYCRCRTCFSLSMTEEVSPRVSTLVGYPSHCDAIMLLSTHCGQRKGGGPAGGRGHRSGAAGWGQHASAWQGG